MKLRALLAVGALLVVGSIANAASVDVYFAGSSDTNNVAKSDFLAQLASPALVESFEGFAVGTKPSSLAFKDSSAVTGLTASLTSSLTSSKLKVDSTDYGNLGPSSGSQYLYRVATGGESVFTLNFSEGIEAFGFFTRDLDDRGLEIKLRLSDNTETSFYPGTAGSAPDGMYHFLGLVSKGAKFTSVTMITNNVSGDGFAIDDITVATTAVPLPPAAWAGLGLMGMLGAIKRFRRTA